MANAERVELISKLKKRGWITNSSVEEKFLISFEGYRTKRRIEIKNLAIDKLVDLCMNLQTNKYILDQKTYKYYVNRVLNSLPGHKQIDRKL